MRYADDFVIVCYNTASAKTALGLVRDHLKRLKLELHPEKTRVMNLGDQAGFDFLGFHFTKFQDHPKAKTFPRAWPSPKSMTKIRKKIREWTGRRQYKLDMEVIVGAVASVIRGWRNYFANFNATRKLQLLDYYMNKRFYRFYRKRYKLRGLKLRKRFTEWWNSCGVEKFYYPGICSRNYRMVPCESNR